MTQDDPIYIQKQAPLGWMVFNRPAKRNAINQAMWSEFSKLLADLESDPEIRVIIFRGVGDTSFSCGMDVDELKALRDANDFTFSPMKPTTAAFDALAKCSKPTISMIHGECIGGGCAIALNTDLRIAADDAYFAMTPAKMGLGYPLKGIERMVQEVGASNARYLFVTAKKINAEHALRIGLVHEVHPKAALEAATIELAHTVASNAPKSIRAALKTIQQVLLSPSDRNSGAIRQWIADCTNSEDYEEGLNAFAEKRAPEFRDR
jgi:enoyl-CoA hydratase